MPIDLALELALLQDKVPPFAFSQVKAIVESQLGHQLDQCFIFFDPEPLAAASIGQVHKARLKNGQLVAVKVQRANLVKTINQDLILMRFIVDLVKSVKPQSDWKSWSKLIDEFEKTIYAEMNYLEEGRNADRLRTILRSFPSIVIPRVLWQHTTKFVITEEFCPGIKIDNLRSLPGVDLRRLAKYLVEAYLEQILKYGFFHADTHPGNLAISSAGQVIIYDFGMMGYLTAKQRLGFVKFIMSIFEKNINLLIDALADLCFINQNGIANRKDLLKLIMPIWTRYHSSSVETVDLAEIEKEMDILLLNKYFKLPANLACLIRMIVTLESVIQALDPNLNFFRVAAPYFKSIKTADI